MKTLGRLIVFFAFLFGMFSLFSFLIGLLNGSKNLIGESIIGLVVSGAFLLIVYLAFLSKSEVVEVGELPTKKTGKDKGSQVDSSDKPLLFSCETRVAGVTFKNKDGTSRQVALSRMCCDDPVFFEREPDNFFDPHAVKVLSKFGCIGYLPRELSFKLKEIDVSTLSAVVAKIGKTDRGGYWSKLLISTDDKDLNKTPAISTEELRGGERSSSVSGISEGVPRDKHYLEINISDYPGFNPLPGHGLTGHVKLKRKYLYFSSVRESNNQDDSILRDQEVVDLVSDILKDELGALMDQNEYSVQKMSKRELDAWQAKVVDCSGALRSCRLGVDDDELRENAGLYFLGMISIGYFIRKLEKIEDSVIFEEVSGYAVDGLFQGDVEIVSSNSKSYFKGGYVDGLKNGVGLEVSPEGYIYEGEYLEGYKNGRGRLRMDGKTLDGFFINGKYFGRPEFNSFNPPEFRLTYNEKLGSVLFTPREGRNKAGAKVLLSTSPDGWSVFDVGIDSLGLRVDSYMETLAESERADFEVKLAGWKYAFSEGAFVNLYSRLYPFYSSESCTIEDYKSIMAKLQEELRDNISYLNSSWEKKKGVVRDYARFLEESKLDEWY